MATAHRNHPRSLVSFTAGQDVGCVYEAVAIGERIGENPFTNQFFLWANLNLPFETSALFPMKNAQRHLQSLGRELPTRFNAELKKNYNGQLKYLEENKQLVWQGVPILAPFVKPIHEKAGDFFCVGTFAFNRQGRARPPELWSQFKGRTDLVYYDWEIAGPRFAAVAHGQAVVADLPCETRRRRFSSAHHKN